MGETVNTLKVINQMQADGVIGKYAIGGAVGATFYIEPASTYDLDIFIRFEKAPGSPLVSLDPIYEYLQKRGHKVEGTHIMIEGWPVQFLPADDDLSGEALLQAVEKDVTGTKAWVMKAEHLMAIALRTGRGKDLIRLEQFVRYKAFDENELSRILARHKLLEKWQRFVDKYINHPL
jgi:hypothetical protein